MKTKEIEELWEQDSFINDVILDEESLRGHKLHNKYYIILNDEKKALYSLEAELKILKRDKWEYYTGILDEEILKERGWLPFGNKVLKSNANLYIESDKDVLKYEYMIGIQTQKVEFLTSIIRQINQRNFLIRDAIEFKKFTNGVV
jgi:hypothetical protein